jgi:hypothetical protein
VGDEVARFGAVDYCGERGVVASCQRVGAVASRSVSAQRSAPGRVEATFPFEPGHLRREVPDLLVQGYQARLVVGPKRHGAVLPHEKTGQPLQHHRLTLDDLSWMDAALGGQLRQRLLLLQEFQDHLGFEDWRVAFSLHGL